MVFTYWTYTSSCQSEDMRTLIIYLFFQNILLLLLFANDKNDGEKEIFKRQRWTASNVVFIILPMTIFILFLYFVVYYLSHLTNTDLFIPTAKYYPYALLLFATFLLIVLFRAKKQSIRVLGVKKKNLGKIIGIGLGVSLLSYASYFILYLLMKQLKPDFHLASSLIAKQYLSNPLSFVIYFCANVFWSPIVEESMYRGIIYSPYRKKFGPKIAILITSLLSSFIHFEITFAAVLIGFLWGILYEKTESIVSPVVAHSIHNLLWFLTEIYVLT